MPLPESEKIPTTLVVGFLGAGKSSLINHILASRPTKPDGSTTRCAVVENELGEVGIDSHLGEFFFFFFFFFLGGGGGGGTQGDVREERRGCS